MVANGPDSVLETSCLIYRGNLQIQRGFLWRDEPYFVCTHSATAGDCCDHGNQAYLPGTGYTVMTWAVPAK